MRKFGPSSTFGTSRSASIPQHIHPAAEHRASRMTRNEAPLLRPLLPMSAMLAAIDSYAPGVLLALREAAESRLQPPAGSDKAKIQYYLSEKGPWQAQPPKASTMLPAPIELAAKLAALWRAMTELKDRHGVDPPRALAETYAETVEAAHKLAPRVPRDYCAILSGGGADGHRESLIAALFLDGNETSPHVLLIPIPSKPLKPCQVARFIAECDRNPAGNFCRGTDELIRLLPGGRTDKSDGIIISHPDAKGKEWVLPFVR